MLKSKFSLTKYPCIGYSEIGKYLTFAPGINKDDLDPVLLGRLAALARDQKKTLNITSGYRSIDSQAKIFLSKGGKCDPKLGYYWPEGFPDSKKKVAKPGSSFHNFRLAIDSDSLWFKAINKVEATAKQTVLLKYGLFKPMTKGNNMPVLEDWHVQTIETLNIPKANRGSLMPTTV